MKTQKEILKWLSANLGRMAVASLTSTDTYALVASVNLSNLISYPEAPQELFRSWRDIVRQMQGHNQHLAYHAIAIELDWSHRRMIWDKAFTSDVCKMECPKSVCCYESGGGGDERSSQLNKK